MTFASVLPYLEAGRRVRRASWTPPYQWHATEGGNWLSMEDGTKPHINVRRDLLASDWEVVEEPAPAKPDCCDRRTCVDISAVEQRDTTIARLTRERDGLRGAYAELRAVAENNAAILDKLDATVKAHL